MRCTIFMAQMIKTCLWWLVQFGWLSFFGVLQVLSDLDGLHNSDGSDAADRSHDLDEVGLSQVAGVIQITQMCLVL